MRLKWALYYTIVLIFLVWCAIAFRADIAQIKFAPVWAAIDAIFLAVLLSLFNYALRVIRWSLYLARLGYSVPPWFVGLTYVAGFAFTLSPGKVGEMVRANYYQKIGIPLAGTSAAFFVERLLDLVAMLSLAFVAFASSSEYHALMWGAACTITGTLVVLAITPWERLSGWLDQATGIPKAFIRPLTGILHTLIFARRLLDFKLLLLGLLLGLVAWASEGVGLMVIGAISPSIPLDWTTAIGIYSVAIIVGALSFLPGGLGSTEAVMVALLAAHGYAMPDAILLTLVCRFLTLWFAVAIGWGAVIVLRHSLMPVPVSR